MNLPLLDHGYVKLIETWGSGEYGELIRHSDVIEREPEAGIIEAARQSTQGAFRGWAEGDCNCVHKGIPQINSATQLHEKTCTWHSGDEKLLKYLYSHNHLTPFEFAGMVIEVQAPIFVFREWHRHRTQSYNEMSARYEPLPDLYYLPNRSNVVDRAVGALTSKNKQESSKEEHSPEGLARATDYFIDHLETFYGDAEALYQTMLKRGIPKELARLSMPVGHYSRMRASANLRNWLAFCTLRMDPKAQWEIRQYALAVGELLSQSFPRTYQLFLNNQSLSK